MQVTIKEFNRGAAVFALLASTLLLHSGPVVAAEPAEDDRVRLMRQGYVCGRIDGALSAITIAWPENPAVARLKTLRAETGCESVVNAIGLEGPK